MVDLTRLREDLAKISALSPADAREMQRELGLAEKRALEEAERARKVEERLSPPPGPRRSAEPGRLHSLLCCGRWSCFGRNNLGYGAPNEMAYSSSVLVEPRWNCTPVVRGGLGQGGPDSL